MHLFAALVPPRDVLDLVSQLAADVRPDHEQGHQPGGRARHLAASGRRFARRRGQGRAPTTLTGPLLDLVPPLHMNVPIAKYGNLALADAARLTDAMELEAADWQAPRLHLRGGIALDPEGDNSVWVRLGGDLDELTEIVRGVSRVAQGLHLFVDRRGFRPEVQLGTVNDATTEAYLEQLLAALEDFESPSWWQSAISLLIPTNLGPEQPPYKVHRHITLGPAVPH